MKKISSGTQELTKVKKQNSPDFLSSRFLNFLSIFAGNSVLRDYASSGTAPGR